MDHLTYNLQAHPQWRMIPQEFGNWHTIYGDFKRWRRAGVWARLMETLRQWERHCQGRRIGKRKPLFHPAAATACLRSAPAGGRCPLAAPAVPTTRGGCLPQWLVARRDAVLRALDMQIKMG